MYYTFTIPKKSGGRRTITAPCDGLKAEQREILKEIEPELQATVFAHGFIKGRSPLTNAKRHCGKRYVLNIDIKDFFPSCKRHSGCYTALEKKVLVKCFRNNELPQGAPTSPLLANYALKDFDCIISSVARKYYSRDIRYTRYADDLTFSSNSTVILSGKFYNCVKSALSSWRFEINESKVWRAGKGDRKNITGYNINAGRPTVPKEYRRKVRAIAHRASKCGWALTKKEKLKLDGLIGHMASAHRAEAKKYRDMVKGITPAIRWQIGRENIKI